MEAVDVVPLQAGDLLQDVHTGDLILLIDKSETESDHEIYDTWNFLNLTAGSHSWWYAAHLEDERDFRRI